MEVADIGTEFPIDSDTKAVLPNVPPAFHGKGVQPHLQGTATAATAKDERRLSGHARHFATPYPSSAPAVDRVT